MKLSWGKCVILGPTLDHHQTLYKMEALKEFPAEYAQSFRASFILLKYFNIRYLEDEPSFFKKNWRFFYIIPLVLNQLFGLIVHMTVLLREGDITGVAYLLPPLLVTLHGTLKAFVLLPKMAQISSFIRSLGSFWMTEFHESHNKDKDALLWTLNLNNKVLFWVTVYGSTLYMMMTFLETVIRRFILQDDCELLLPIASSYPFNPTRNWVIYILVYFFQLYSMLLVVSIFIGSELITIALCGLLGATFFMLQDDLSSGKSKRNRGINFNANYKEDSFTIEEFIKRHQRLIGLSEQLDNIFNQMVFIDLLFTGITMCAFSLAANFARNRAHMIINYIAVATTLLANLCMCYYGEYLTRSSVRIGDLAYENLYDGGVQNKAAIWLIIIISQHRPSRLTSLKYAVVSLNMFTKVISTTWSYFSLLNSVYSEE